MNKDLVSVIIPSYNSKATIEICILSVVNQTHNNFELIIVDDGSTDNSDTFVKSILSKLEKTLTQKIIFLSQKNQGPSAARNLGIENSSGNFIAFLDSDDEWHPSKLQVQLEYMNNDDSLQLCATAFGKKRISESLKYKYVSFSDLLFKNYFSTPTVLVRSAILNNLKFDYHQRNCEDHKLWLQIAYDQKCVYVNTILANNILFKKDFGEVGLSSNLWEMEKGEMSNYLFLLKNGKINFLLYLLAMGYSFLKFLRRFTIIKISKINSSKYGLVLQMFIICYLAVACVSVAIAQKQNFPNRIEHIITNDDTRQIQDLINNLAENQILDGHNKTYVVTSLWLKSNMTIKNFNFICKAGDVPDVSVLNIGNDLTSAPYHNTVEAALAFKKSQTIPGISKVNIINIHIDGNRINQSNLNLRDGGRHGISIKGFASDVIIENSSTVNCATDGIAIYRGLHTKLEEKDELQAAKRITIKNFVSKNNRRHGGSGDSMDGFICENSTFENNGVDVSDVKGSVGSKGAKYLDKVYGNGWDMEGYGKGSAVSNIVFDNCTFINNSGSGLVFYDVTNTDEKYVKKRKNIKLKGCTFDSGTENPSGQYCLVFSSTIANKSNALKLYSNISIENCKLYGMLIFRSCENVTILNSDQILDKREVSNGILDNVKNIKSIKFNSNKENWILNNVL